MTNMRVSRRRSRAGIDAGVGESRVDGQVGVEAAEMNTLSEEDLPLGLGRDDIEGHALSEAGGERERSVRSVGVE